MATEGTTRYNGCAGMIVDRAMISDSRVIPGSSDSLQMVDHTLIDMLFYLDSPYYKGHCKVMCVSSAPPFSPVIIGNMRGSHQMLPDPDWKAEDQKRARNRKSTGNNNDDDNQGFGWMPDWMFKEVSNRD